MSTPLSSGVFGDLRAALDAQCRADLLSSGAVEINRNADPAYDDWISDIIIAFGQPMVRDQAFELARSIGDNNFYGAAIEAKPWLNTAPVDLERAVAILHSFACPATIPDDSQIPIEMTWPTQQRSAPPPPA